jgi:predicted NUDIX family NTP pyrophosphohydrolase
MTASRCAVAETNFIMPIPASTRASLLFPVQPTGNGEPPTGGKVVQAWAVEGDWDPALIRSNTFEMEWPPHSGRRRVFPEIDRAAWFAIADARRKILKGQGVFVDRLLEGLGPSARAGVASRARR